jgi:ubiquitin-activating enzyme E1
VVLPHVTESYGDSADPPDPAVPVCTLKSFPYKIEHTIQWARELFEECFTAMPARAEAMVEVATDALAKPAADAAQEEAPGGDEGSASPGKKKKKKKESRAASKKHSSRGIQKAQNQLAARAVVAAALETNDGSEEDALVMLQRAGRAVKCLEEAVSSTSSSSPPTTVTIETVTTNAKEGSEEGGALLAARCLEWAAFELVSEKVVGEVKAVLAQHPAGTIDTETGLPFWQGTRRLPAAPVLDTNPEGGQAALVVAAARLRVDNFLGTQEDVSPESKVSLAAQRAAAIAGLTPEAAADAIARVAKRTAAAQQASNKRDASKATAKEAEASLEGSGNDVVSTEKEKALLSAAALLVKHARWRQAASASVARSRFTGPLQPLEFEKDDDTNGHLAFVAAASNLRANCYRIPPADALATKLTAGRIVPAIATTTSVVAGLSALELVKMAALRQHQKRASSKGQSIDAQKEPVAPLKVHRNAFLSLALPVFAFSEPVAAAVYPYGNNGLSEEGEDEEDEEGSEENGEAGKETYPATFTTWDRLQIDGRNGALPLSDVVARVERAAGPGAVLRSLSFGGRLLFTDYPPFDLPSRLRKPIIEILEEDPRQGTGGSDDDYSGRGEKMATARTSALQLPSFEGKQFVDLEALVEDEEDGELLDMPPVRVHLQEPK